MVKTEVPVRTDFTSEGLLAMRCRIKETKRLRSSDGLSVKDGNESVLVHFPRSDAFL